MRRPLSIMRASIHDGSVEFLYKTLGAGTEALAGRVPGERLSVLGPIGRGFEVNESRKMPLLLGGGVGIPPMIFLAERLRDVPGVRPLALMGSEVEFPFRPRPSEILIEGMPGDAIACLPLLDDWGIPSRLSSRQGFPGCFDGFVTDLAERWLDSLDASALGEVEVLACGPSEMLSATAKLAARFGLPARVCLEEYMACGVGGCAGCVVRVYRGERQSMLRVCVDGPVFDAYELEGGHGMPEEATVR